MAASLLSFWYRFVEPFTDWFQVFSFVASLITIICFAMTYDWKEIIKAY